MKNQKGFSVVHAILIVIIVGILGFAGWYVWDSNQKNKPQDRLHDSVKRSEPRTALTPTTAPASSQKYIVIKEWGVKIPENNGKTISYRIQEDKNLADFVSSEQKALGGNCGQYTHSRAHVYRSENGATPNDPILANKLNQAVLDGYSIKLGNYTYFILVDMSGGDCTGTAKAGDSITIAEQNVNQNLYNALKGMIKE